MILPSSDTRAGEPQSFSTDALPLPAPEVVDGHLAREQLDARAQRLFASLPWAYRLPVTRQRFPHVLNRLAAEWEVPMRFLGLMDELLIDHRGNREGFPFDSVLELTNLREYYLNEVHVGLRRRLDARRSAW
ncbi:MAG: hypothetical protein M9907_07850 [Burkholderiaceae bacterium]|nr:hypothetical protein [Burkholderiaceae bacterium]